MVVEEPADRFGGGGQMFGDASTAEQPGGRRERGDLAAGLVGWCSSTPGSTSIGVREGSHLVPGHADGEAGAHIVVANASTCSLPRSAPRARELLTPLLPHGVKQLPVAVDDPDRLLKDGRDDSFRRQFEQLQDERAADAAAEHQEPVDAEMIHDRQLVWRA